MHGKKDTKCNNIFCILASTESFMQEFVVKAASLVRELMYTNGKYVCIKFY